MSAVNIPEVSERPPHRDSVRLRVFISYSRRDVGFADQLVAALAAFGFTPLIDRKDISAENWMRRLDQLILNSDAVVFVLTPESAESDMCRWEVGQALALNKRIVPVLAEPLGNAKPPELLRAVNYLYFYSEPEVPGSGFGSGLAHLISVLSVDIEWTREHTRLGLLASSWKLTNADPADLLLRGTELERWLKWRDTRPPNAPELTSDQRAFLQASEDAEDERIRIANLQIEERQRAVKQAEEAQRKEAAALATLRKRTRRGIVALSALFALAVGTALVAFWQARNLERASLRLREDLKLRIADTEHPVEASEQWYRIVTDFKLAIGAYISLKKEGMQTGSGFLVQGGNLRDEWKSQVVFLTASHVIRPQNGKPDLSQGYLVFPGVNREKRVRVEDILFESRMSDLDVAVLRLSALPRHAVAVELAGQTEAKQKLKGVAVLYWTPKSFWIGIGHGISRPSDTGARVDRMHYTHATEGGASGAPVFDADSGKVVCLHQAGYSKPQQRAARPTVGECMSIAKIVAAIAASPPEEIRGFKP